ncbi:hypothetical protein BDB00DRAFT_866537 [Zychaea mexicana]|uniref:uncharacterized protein n=1 Tax=Zychaea mexicana TaxID=64656 RepID=UPI0022FE5B6E|nr:uncharacterized protein BDB00DRAFT_866537 [Zychaea mexicana]KAI9499677.1 hypothetical protein BDB00DRAFT_866537 [Zychaea mexicana]
MAVEEARLFANNFWGKDDAGYNVLMHKMNMAKKTCEDLRALYSAKASLHEDFGKKLAKQTKMELGREETGTLKILFASAQKEMEAAAQANIELAQKIRSELELSIENFILEQKDRRKLVQTNVDKAHRNKQLHAAHVAKAKEKYEAECAKQVSLESQLTSTSVGYREADRLRQKLERSQNEIKTLEKEYKNACSKLADATATWNSEWKVACYRFQDMEEKRIEFLHHSLCIYVNILSTASGQDQESYERFWKALDQCNPKADIEQFIEERGTGNMIPEPPVYVDYNDDPAKTLPRYQIAQFTENDNNFTTTTTATAIYNVPTSSTLTGTISSVAGGAITNIIKSTAKRSTSFCEPKRRSSTRLTKQLPPVVHQQPQQRSSAKDEQIVTRLDNRRVNLYASVNEKLKKPAPAAADGTATATTIHQHCHEEEEEESIDPRAQVVVSIGNNMFSVDNQHTVTTDTTTTAPRRSSIRSKTKRRSTSSLYHEHHADMEEAFSDSIKDLLQELGVQQHQQQPSSTTRAAVDKMRRRQSLNNSSNNISNNGHQRYSMEATTTAESITASAGMTAAANTPVITTTTMSGNRMIWARALYDCYSERPEDLSFTRGQWLAIVRNDDLQWWLAHKWDDASGRLSETCGYVASNFVQIC